VTEKPIDLDQRRGLSAQRATESRRLISKVEAHEARLHRLRAEAEQQFLALPAATWEEAGVKAKYLLRLYAETLAGGDARTTIPGSRAQYGDIPFDPEEVFRLSLNKTSWTIR
jgi:hypothetical protein